MAYSIVNTIQSTTNVASAKAMSSLTVQAGDLLVVHFHSDNATNAATGTGETLTQRAQISAGGNYTTVLECFVVNTGSLVINLTSGGNIGSAIIRQYRGIASYIGKSTEVQRANPGAGANTIAANNVNATSQPALIVAGYLANDSTLVTIGTTLSWQNGLLNVSDGAFAIGMEDIRVTSTGNVAATFGNTNNQTYLLWSLAYAESAIGTTRGNPFDAGNAFNGGRTFAGIMR